LPFNAFGINGIGLDFFLKITEAAKRRNILKIGLGKMTTGDPKSDQLPG
jgi:hypothetical protein